MKRNNFIGKKGVSLHSIKKKQKKTIFISSKLFTMYVVAVFNLSCYLLNSLVLIRYVSTGGF